MAKKEESAEQILARIRAQQKKRHTRWLDKQRAQGRRTVTVLLSLEASERIEELRAETGLSIEKIISRALLEVDLKKWGREKG